MWAYNFSWLLNDLDSCTKKETNFLDGNMVKEIRFSYGKIL